jgi:hypothetical protein
LSGFLFWKRTRCDYSARYRTHFRWMLLMLQFYYVSDVCSRTNCFNFRPGCIFILPITSIDFDSRIASKHFGILLQQLRAACQSDIRTRVQTFESW